MVFLFTTIIVLTIQWRPRNRFHFQHREFSNIQSHWNNLTFHYAGFSTSHHQNSVTLNSIILVRVTMHERRGAFYYSRPTGQRLVGIPDNLWFMAEEFSWRTAINNSRNIFFWHFFSCFTNQMKEVLGNAQLFLWLFIVAVRCNFLNFGSADCRQYVCVLRSTQINDLCSW